MKTWTGIDNDWALFSMFKFLEKIVIIKICENCHSAHFFDLQRKLSLSETRKTNHIYYINSINNHTATLNSDLTWWNCTETLQVSFQTPQKLSGTLLFDFTIPWTTGIQAWACPRLHIRFGMVFLQWLWTELVVSWSLVELN